MTPISIYIASEDLLSEAIATRLAEMNGFVVGHTFRKQGFGYLKANVENWNRLAAGNPVLLLTDLDATECPMSLIEAWLPNGLHKNMLLRVAVREVESWLIADHAAITKFLKAPPSSVSANPDELRNPKAALIELARRHAPANIRSRIVPPNWSSAQQGPDYNACLIEYVQGVWDPHRAAERSNSLYRMMIRLREFEPIW